MTTTRRPLPGPAAAPSLDVATLLYDDEADTLTLTRPDTGPLPLGTGGYGTTGETAAALAAAWIEADAATCGFGAADRAAYLREAAALLATEARRASFEARTGVYVP